MPKRHLPENPSLENLRKQAKALLHSARAGEAGSLALVQEFHPRAAEVAGALALHDAQLVIARSYGFASWARLKEHLEVVARYVWDPPSSSDAARGDGSVLDAFLRRACLIYGDWDPAQAARARLLLAEHPELARASIHAAATVGDVAAAREMLARDPTLVGGKGGALGWEPLLYACYSRLDSDAPGHSTLAVARLLLEHGADPNAGFLWCGNVPPFTALTGAFGEGEGGNKQPPHRERDALARLLLEAGADPNDGQTLYNRHFNRDDGHLRLLFEYGFGQDKRGPWFERLGERNFTPGKMLVEELWAAAMKDFSERVRLLIRHGVDVNGRSFRDGRTPYEIAVLSGNAEIAAYLLQHGASKTEFTPEETFAAACTSGERERALAMRARDPGLIRRIGAEHCAKLLSTAVEARRPAAVRLMAELGFDLDALTCGRTALHETAWGGDPAMIALLVELGADPRARDSSYNGTPLGWAAYNHQSAAVEYLLRFADLFEAVECDAVERVRALLEQDPTRVNQPYEDGNALAFAFHEGMQHAPELIELVVSKGADLNARNRKGETALDHALAHGHDRTAELLRRHGARTAAELRGP